MTDDIRGLCAGDEPMVRHRTDVTNLVESQIDTKGRFLRVEKLIIGPKSRYNYSSLFFSSTKEYKCQLAYVGN